MSRFVLCVCQIMTATDGCVDSPWWTPPNSALADVTNSPLGVTSLPADDVTASEDGTTNEALDLSRHQTFTAASTSSDDVTAGAVSGPGWCDVTDDDDDDDDDGCEHQAMMSLTTTTPYRKRSCTGVEIFASVRCDLSGFFIHEAFSFATVGYWI